MIDERKGHTQARFFSRKNSNSNSNILNSGTVSSSMMMNQNMSQMQQNFNSNPAQVLNSRHNFSPQQQQAMKLQK
jgi:hypothetical protein